MDLSVLYQCNYIIVGHMALINIYDNIMTTGNIALIPTKGFWHY